MLEISVLPMLPMLELPVLAMVHAVTHMVSTMTHVMCTVSSSTCSHY